MPAALRVAKPASMPSCWKTVAAVRRSWCVSSPFTTTIADGAGADAMDAFLMSGGRAAGVLPRPREWDYLTGVSRSATTSLGTGVKYGFDGVGNPVTFAVLQLP